MNLSQWGIYDEGKRNKLLGETCNEVSDGEMPGVLYMLMHPAARLTKADVQMICRWTETSKPGLPVRSE
jgi:Haem-binding domain